MRNERSDYLESSRIIGGEDSPARAKFRALSQMKVQHPEKRAEYNRMLQYLSKASLYKVNDGLGREYRRSQSTLADRIKIQDSDSVRLIE